MNQQALTVANRKPTDQEKAFISEITKPGSRIDVLIPNDIDPKEWNKNTSWISRALLRAELQQQALLPVLGRLLLIAKEHKAEIWPEFETFKEFIIAEAPKRFGIEKSTAYEAMNIAQRWPDLESKDYREIGRLNFRVLNQAIGKGQENHKYAKELLEKAKESTETELRELCLKKKYISEKGDTQGAYVNFGCNKTQFRQFEKFFANADFQAYCGTDNRADMILKAIAEATTEWVEQIKEDEKSAGQPAKVA